MLVEATGRGICEWRSSMATTPARNTCSVRTYRAAQAVWAYDRKNIRRHSSNCRELNFLKFDGGLPVLDPVPRDGDHGGPQVARGGASQKTNMEEIRCRYPKASPRSIACLCCTLSVETSVGLHLALGHLPHIEAPPGLLSHPLSTSPVIATRHWRGGWMQTSLTAKRKSSSLEIASLV
jgi:hypothetical protein